MLLTTFLIVISYGIDGKNALVYNKKSRRILEDLRDSIIPELTQESRSIASRYAEKHFSKRDYEISLEYLILKPNISNALKTDPRNLLQYMSSFQGYSSTFSMFAKSLSEMNKFPTIIENIISKLIQVGPRLKTSPTQGIKEYIEKETTIFLKSLPLDVLGKVCPAMKYDECYTRVIIFTLMDQFNIFLSYFQNFLNDLSIQPTKQ